MGGLGILVLSIAWIFYRRMKNSSSNIKDILLMPEFRDRTVEIKLFGGLASFKISADQSHSMLLDHRDSPHLKSPLIENNIIKTEQKILELTALFEKKLITKEEFKKAKQDIIQG